VKEVILPAGTTTAVTDRVIDVNNLKAVLDRCGVVVTERKPCQCEVFKVYRLTNFDQPNFPQKMSPKTSRVFLFHHKGRPAQQTRL
jgi:hypothetical protein